MHAYKWQMISGGKDAYSLCIAKGEKQIVILSFKVGTSELLLPFRLYSVPPVANDFVDVPGYCVLC